MYNDIHIGGVTIHMYGFMIAIGFLIAYIVTEVRAKKRNLDSDIIFGILWCAILGGLVGTRLLYYIVSIGDIIDDPSIIWNFSNGYVVYGGIIGGVAASYIYSRIKKFNFLDYFDLVMPSVALAQGFGRIGCFFAGCCYGRETDSVIGITFNNSAYAPNGVKLIPTQLISSAGDFIIAAILFVYAGRNKRDGRVASLYLILYSIGRFLVEFLRNDYRGSVGPFSTSQIIAFMLCIVGVVLFIKAGKSRDNEIEC